MIITKKEFFNNKNKYLKIIKKGIFIYPTDTIYGIGCDARNGILVEKIRELKKRPKMPFSIIAPNKEWLKKNCIINKKINDYLKKLPGPYTFILKLKNPEEIAFSVNKGIDTIGIRIPNHWISNIVNKLGFPIITTSANISGGNYMTRVEDLPLNFLKEVDLIIYEGEIKGKPSTIIDLSKEKAIIKER